ncbi:MAG TPA: NAD(P)-dependent oxidoreductase [Bryobacteraceae bacterium]|nr:NAD(P)-dependent oxidoreductase [Bryobacteraceae bacterium]
MKIAFIGTGNMGAPMALNLIHAGHEVTVYNRTREKLEPLAQAGAHVANSPADAVRAAEVVITMLANDYAVREATLVSEAIDALARGAIHMSASTISVALSKELAAAHASRGQGYVAAPVLGRPDSAAAQKLWIMAAGPPDQINRCRSLMDAIGRAVTVVGEEAWRANLAKITMNFMLASMLETMGEAFALVRKAGIGLDQFFQIMNGLYNSPVYANYGKIVADRRFEPAGFRLTLGLKDIGLALDAGQDFAVPMPLASLIRDQYLTAIAHGRADADWSAITEVPAQNAGL